MKWFVCVTLLTTILSGCAATQNAEFRERAEIYSRLIDCDYYKTDDNQYTELVSLSDVKDAQPSGYNARVPVYFIGPRDGHVILSVNNTLDRDKDFAYEFLFGGYGNTKIVIRKRIQSYPLKEVERSTVISELRPLKALIEVHKDGFIRVYTDNSDKPALEAYDPFVLPVQYMSFASYQGAAVEFLYNCSTDTTTPLAKDDAKQEIANGDLSKVPLPTLVAQCKTEETWELEYNKFHELESFKNAKADGYRFKLPLLVYGQKEVHILLSSTEKPNIDKESAYEIVIGGYGGSRHVIRKTVEGDDLFEKVQLKDLLSGNQQSRVLIQMTNDGLLEVFVGDLQYKPIVKAFDAKPLDVKYVSFASNDGARVLFFYNCVESDPVLPVTAHVAHPLFAEPTEHNEEILANKCKHLHAWEDKYSTPLKLDSIKNSKPEGFIVQLPLLVKGVRDAHILLTTGSLDPRDGYEIVLGGWGDTKHLIRKNGDVVAKINEFNVLNEYQPIKVIVELTQDGELRVFTDANKFVPLMTFKDPKPIENLSTFSFTAYFRDLDFYYGCSV